jgi:PhnB protein
VTSQMATTGPVISLMLAADDASAAAQWYAQALGAVELWNLGSVVGLAVDGAPFFLGEPANNGWDTPAHAGTRTARVELFASEPDRIYERAVAAGADGTVDEIRDHHMPWGVHRQGGFLDPFGHLWLVGDRSPLSPHGQDPAGQAGPRSALAISHMLAVSDAGAAADWYHRALGAKRLWDLGGVVGLSVGGAPFFLGEPEGNGWQTPGEAGTRTIRIELFDDDPDSFVGRAVRAGAARSVADLQDHQRPWGIHRQGGFTDPFGHIWLVGDKAPLSPH